jgi:hypothetical protein
MNADRTQGPASQPMGAADPVQERATFSKSSFIAP